VQGPGTGAEYAMHILSLIKYNRTIISSKVKISSIMQLIIQETVGLNLPNKRQNGIDMSKLPGNYVSVIMQNIKTCHTSTAEDILI